MVAAIEKTIAGFLCAATLIGILPPPVLAELPLHNGPQLTSENMRHLDQMVSTPRAKPGETCTSIESDCHVVEKAAAASLVAGDFLVIGDWAVGCDNNRECHAASLPVEGDTDEPIGDGNLTISIRRSGNPGGMISVSFSAASAGSVDVSQQVDDAMRLPGLIAIDGRKFGHRMHKQETGYGFDGNAALMLIAAMRGKREVSLADIRGQPVAAASLRGLDKALAHFDARQFLTGTVAALEQPGNKPVNAQNVPPLIRRQRITVAGKLGKPPATVDDDQLSQLRATDPCLENSPEAEPGSPGYYRLDSDNTLMILPTTCGGYNPFSMLFVVGEDRRAVSAHFWEYPGAGKADEPQLPDVGWDEESRLLNSFGRGRVLADCGQIQDFAWYQGKFKLVHDAVMSPCRGSTDYITIYRIEVIVDGRPKTGSAH